MPARKKWVMGAAEEFYLVIQDRCAPEIARCFHLDIHTGYVYVYCEGHAPSAVLAVLNHAFFLAHGIKSESWEKMFCLPWSGETWVLYDVKKHANFPGGKFGWRHRE